MAAAIKKTTTAVKKTSRKKDDVDELYSILHRTDDYKEMVKAGKVSKIKNGVRIG